MAPTDEERVEALTAQLLTECPPDRTPDATLLGRQFDLGLAWVHFPQGCGGLGLPRQLNRTVTTTIARAGGPIGGSLNPIGYGMCAPALVEHGDDAQRALLRPLFTNEDIWCQLFSEPGAGSDVAALATRAVRYGEEWRVDGQKVWTTLAHTARYGLLIARSDPELPKHSGLTAFIVDMHAPGVEVRPLRQITGDAEFNEVFFADARIPDSMRLDAPGRGWAVALTTLMNERVSIGGGTPPRESGPIGQLLRLWRSRPEHDPVLRDVVATLWIAAEVNRLTNMRAASLSRSGTPGPEGSVGKLAMAELNKEIYDVAMDILGAEALLVTSYAQPAPVLGLFGDDLQRNFLRSRANSIEGGTSEVMRNILAERVLGLPGDVRVDKGVPWSSVPR